MVRATPSAYRASLTPCPAPSSATQGWQGDRSAIAAPTTCAAGRGSVAKRARVWPPPQETQIDLVRDHAGLGSKPSMMPGATVPGCVQQAQDSHTAPWPFICLSFAQSVDGSISDREGELVGPCLKWPGARLALTGCPRRVLAAVCCRARAGRMIALSCPAAMRMTHELRAAHDAIVVGVGTVKKDNPSLTVRLCDGRTPWRRSPKQTPLKTKRSTQLWGRARPRRSSARRGCSGSASEPLSVGAFSRTKVRFRGSSRSSSRLPPPSCLASTWAPPAPFEAISTGSQSSKAGSHSRLASWRES